MMELNEILISFFLATIIIIFLSWLIPKINRYRSRRGLLIRADRLRQDSKEIKKSNFYSAIENCANFYEEDNNKTNGKNNDKDSFNRPIFTKSWVYEKGKYRWR